MARRAVKLHRLSPKAFAAEMRREGESRFPQYVRDVQAATAYVAYGSIVMLTPVLTGRARINWMVSAGAPSYQTVDYEQAITDIGHWFPVTGAPMSSEEQARIMSVVNAVRRLPLGVPIFISNRLRYIEALEQGTSGKAPAGMVEVSLLAVTMSADRVTQAVDLLPALG